jgi:hypothetical protein
MSVTLFCLLIKRRNPMSLAYLKVKIKSLAAEARIIRHEEEIWKRRGRPYRLAHNAMVAEFVAGRTKSYSVPDDVKPFANADSTFWGLRFHRIRDVRIEARAAQLAYAFLRGKPYSLVEPTGKDNGGRQTNPIDWQRVTKIAAKYGPDQSLKATEVTAWYAAEVGRVFSKESAL